jgi:hypothetical protein
MGRGLLQVRSSGFIPSFGNPLLLFFSSLSFRIRKIRVRRERERNQGIIWEGFGFWG